MAAALGAGVDNVGIGAVASASAIPPIVMQARKAANPRQAIPIAERGILSSTESLATTTFLGRELFPCCCHLHQF
jgi:hypothetical protein